MRNMLILYNGNFKVNLRKLLTKQEEERRSGEEEIQRPRDQIDRLEAEKEFHRAKETLKDATKGNDSVLNDLNVMKIEKTNLENDIKNQNETISLCQQQFDENRTILGNLKNECNAVKKQCEELQRLDIVIYQSKSKISARNFNKRVARKRRNAKKNSKINV